MNSIMQLLPFMGDSIAFGTWSEIKGFGEYKHH